MWAQPIAGSKIVPYPFMHLAHHGPLEGFGGTSNWRSSQKYGEEDSEIPGGTRLFAACYVTEKTMAGVPQLESENLAPLSSAFTAFRIDRQIVEGNCAHAGKLERHCF